MKLAAFDR